MRKMEKVALSNAYRIFETSVFAEDLEKVPTTLREKLKSILKNQVYPILKEHPYFGINIKKLVNYHPPTWRYRIGDFRIFYSVDDANKIISILTISNRKDAY